MNQMLLRRRVAKSKITLLNAIQMTNYNYLEDFKFSPTSSFKLEFDCKLPSGRWGGFFRIQVPNKESWQNYRVLSFAKYNYNNNSSDTFHYNGNYKTGTATNSTVRHILKVDNWKAYYNGVLKTDASTLKGNFEEGCLLSINNEIIIYSLKVWIDEVYVGELLPAKQGLNVGLVNMLNNKFYKLNAIEI